MMSNNERELTNKDVEHKIRNNFRSYSTILRGVMKSFPNMSVRDISFFAPVYYPIAILDVGVEEESFTDFQGFEIAVLKLIENGITKSSSISALLGLTENYVGKILSMLAGINYLDANGITPLGREAIKENRKKAYHHVTHAVQVNAVTAEVVSLQDLLRESDLDDKRDTPSRIHHLGSVNRIEREKAVREIIKDYSENLSTEDIHINVREIDSISFKELKYTKCYAIKFNSDPLVILMNRKTARGRIRYNNFRPIGVSTVFLKEKYGFDEDVPICSARENEVYNIFYDSMLRESTGVSDERIEEEREAIKIALEPNLGRVVNAYSGREVEEVYTVVAEDFESLNTWAVSFIQDIANSGVSVIGRDSFKGKLIKLIVEDKSILTAIESIKKRYNGSIDRSLRDYLISETKGCSGVRLWKRITEIVESNDDPEEV